MTPPVWYLKNLISPGFDAERDSVPNPNLKSNGSDGFYSSGCWAGWPARGSETQIEAERKRQAQKSSQGIK
jgi:hypothetical protein